MSAPLSLVADVSPLDTLRACIAAQSETILAGCAGTGKTWHVQHLLGRGVVLCAPTARAAGRLTEVTRQRAFTVHSLIYGAPVEQWVKSDGEVCKGWTDAEGIRRPSPGCPGCMCTPRLGFKARDSEDDELIHTIIVDEASMVGAELADHIRAYAVQQQAKLVWVGDPAQLPPVGDEAGVNLSTPDVLLEHVYRQDGGILELATRIRQAKHYGDIAEALRGEYEGVEFRYDGLSGLANWRAGKSRRMAIVHTNRQRTDANAHVRSMLKRAGPLVRGDRIIIRKNARQVPVWNGEVYVIEATEKHGQFTKVLARLDGGAPVSLSFVVDERYLGTADPNEYGRNINELRHAFQHFTAVEHSSECTFFSGMMEDDCPRSCKPGVLAGHSLVNAQHGFVITCHAAQGSEAEEVGVLWSPYTHGDRFTDARSWLYTAVTRAKRSLVLWGTR